MSPSYVTCQICDALTPTYSRWAHCVECHHRIDVPLAQCDCFRCELARRRATSVRFQPVETEAVDLHRWADDGGPVHE